MPLLRPTLAAALAACSLCGCAPSSLIPKGQPAFERAQARLKRSLDRIKNVQASDQERALFAQAEAFHDFRFGFPPQGWLAYLAQTVAAATDFPGFQSLAGSLDMLELRLQAENGAVLLWETLLEQHPQTGLAPLALYRLGWAYRSASAYGLPRDAELAFAGLLKDFPDSEPAAFARLAQEVPAKSKSWAAGLSLIPGAGQAYTGQWGGGAIRFGVAAAALAMIVAPSVEAYRRQEDLNWNRDWPLLLTGMAGLVFLSVDYTQAYQGAMRGVVEYNEAREDEFEAAHPGAP